MITELENTPEILHVVLDLIRLSGKKLYAEENQWKCHMPVILAAAGIYVC